jgi:hypothetical protein
MSDWQVGDLALCVAPEGRWIYPNEPDCAGPKRGQVLTVEKLEICPEERLRGELFLCFTNWPDDAFRAVYFRKIRPHQADEFDRQVIEQMNGAPVEMPA